MKWRWGLGGSLAILLAVPLAQAQAQAPGPSPSSQHRPLPQPPPAAPAAAPTQDPGLGLLQADINALTADVNSYIMLLVAKRAESDGAYMREVRRLQEVLTYAVACGDKPGCFTPVPTEPPTPAATLPEPSPSK